MKLRAWVQYGGGAARQHNKFNQNYFAERSRNYGVDYYYNPFTSTIPVHILHAINRFHHITSVRSHHISSLPSHRPLLPRCLTSPNYCVDRHMIFSFQPLIRLSQQSNLAYRTYRIDETSCLMPATPSLNYHQ